MHKKELFLSNRFINNESIEISPKSNSKAKEKLGVFLLFCLKCLIVSKIFFKFEIHMGVASIFREKKNNEISTKKYTVNSILILSFLFIKIE